MTRTLEMCVEASLARQARHGWECQTPSRSVSLHMLFQSTISGIIREKKNIRDWAGKKEWERCVSMCIWGGCVCGGGGVSEGFTKRGEKEKRGCWGQKQCSN